MVPGASLNGAGLLLSEAPGSSQARAPGSIRELCTHGLAKGRRSRLCLAGPALVPPSRLAEAPRTARWRKLVVTVDICLLRVSDSETPALEMVAYVGDCCDSSPVTAPLATPTVRDSESRPSTCRRLPAGPGRQIIVMITVTAAPGGRSARDRRDSTAEPP